MPVLRSIALKWPICWSTRDTSIWRTRVPYYTFKMPARGGRNSSDNIFSKRNSAVLCGSINIQRTDKPFLFGITISFIYPTPVCTVSGTNMRHSCASVEHKFFAAAPFRTFIFPRLRASIFLVKCPKPSVALLSEFRNDYTDLCVF